MKSIKNRIAQLHVYARGLQMAGNLWRTGVPLDEYLTGLLQARDTSAIIFPEALREWDTVCNK